MMIETTQFRLAQGVTDDVFLVTDEKVRNEFLYQQEGLIRATTARSSDGDWIVIVHWWGEQWAKDLPDELLALTQDAVRHRYETFD